MSLFYSIIGVVLPDAKLTKAGEPRKTNFLSFDTKEFPWLNDKGQPVQIKAREFSSLVSSLMDVCDSVDEVPEKQLSKLSSKVPGLSSFMEENQISARDFWKSVYNDLASEESDSDPAFRFYRLILGQTPMEDLESANVNDILQSFIQKQEEAIAKMKDSALQYDPDTFKIFLEEKQAKNGLTSETIKVKGGQDRIVNYVNLKAPKAK